MDGDRLRRQQAPLKDRYRSEPDAAVVSLRAEGSVARTDVVCSVQTGNDDTQIFAVTTFVALRLAFSTVNDALGSRPDYELGQQAPAPLRDAVSFGRSVDRA